MHEGNVEASEEQDAAGLCTLRLYVAGRSGRCLKAIANLSKICSERLEGRCSIEVVDLLESPDRGSPDPDKSASSVRDEGCGRPIRHRTRPHWPRSETGQVVIYLIPISWKAWFWWNEIGGMRALHPSGQG